MRLPDFEYMVPESVDELLGRLKNSKGQSRLVAGGTDLLPSMKQGLFKPEILLLLNRLADFQRIEYDEGSGLKIGALVTLHDLETSPLVGERYPAIAQAAGAAASPQLRHMGTVGGNLNLDTRCYYYNQSAEWRKCRPTCIKVGGNTCNAIGGGKKCFAAFSGDMAPALIPLGATVRLISEMGERVVPLVEYYTGDGANPFIRRDDEFLAGIEVPILPEGVFCSYQKFSIRKSIDFPLAGVGAMIHMDEDGETCQSLRLAIGGVTSGPREVEKASALLKGQKLNRDLIEEAAEEAYKAAKPVANQGSTPSYRKIMVRELVKKALLGVRNDPV